LASDQSDALGGQDEARSIQFLPDGPRIPVDLIRARDAGEVIFIVGAGASKGSGFPLFWELTRDAYLELTGKDPGSKDQVQRSVFKAFEAGAFDFVLGQLEREIDGGHLDGRRPRRVRDVVAEALSVSDTTPFDRHRSLLILARDQRGEPRLVTTNFDTLLERAWESAAGSIPLSSRAGASLPGPGTIDFRGVLHLHGRLPDKTLPAEITGTDLVLTDADFGDAYLRSGWAARFLYDLVRRYTLVLVGYGAEDPPLKYLLSVIGADRSRFSDLKPIYAFFHSTSDEADAVTSEWLAKSITPLLYDPNGQHRHLYDTLAEWSRYVDDPTGWSDSRLEAIGSKHYDECENHERSLLELLLLSPANCTRAKAAGASFSLIRAIEASRPGISGPAGRPGRFNGDADSYLTAFGTWTWQNLDTIPAAEWAIERLSTPHRISLQSDDGAVADDRTEPRQSTSVHGLSAEEIESIERQWQHHADHWSREYLVFWLLLVRAAKRHGNSLHEMAYDIIGRLKRFADKPLLDDARRLARFMLPDLQVRRAFTWNSEYQRSETSPMHLASFGYHWNKHPGHRDIADALPDNSTWLQHLLRNFGAALDDIYALSEEIEINSTRDLLSAGCQRVATDPNWLPDHVVDEDGERTDPDQYGSDHIVLIRTMTAAWRRLLALDSWAAFKVVQSWAQRDEELYRRLHLWALTADAPWPDQAVEEALVGVSDELLWRPNPEAMAALVHNWPRLKDDVRCRIEYRILALPDLKSEPPERSEILRQIYEATAADLLAAFEKISPLSDKPAAFLESFRARTGKEPQGLGRLGASRWRISSVKDPDAGPLAELVGEELVQAMLSDLAEDHFASEPRTSSLIQSDPLRVLEAIGRFRLPGTGAIWRRLLSHWVGRQDAAGVSEASKLSILHYLQEMPPAILDDTASAAAYWLQGIAVGQDEIVLPFLCKHEGAVLGAWRHTARRAFRSGEVETYRPNQGERLMSQALNQPAGILAFVGIALVDRAARNPASLPVLTDARDEIDETLAGVGAERRLLVAARVSEWLGLAERLIPKSAEQLVMIPLERDPPELILLDLHLLYGRGMSEAQYRRLEPLMLAEARSDRLSQQGKERNVGRMTWRALDRFAGEARQAPTSSGLRSILQRSTPDVRASMARVCRNWFEVKDEADRPRFWECAGKPFFKTVWPLDAALRHPSVSQEIMRLPAATGEDFDEAVAVLIPLTVPYQLYDITSLFISLRKDTDYGSLSSVAKDFVVKHWSAFLNIIDAALGPNPTVRPHDLASWLEDLHQKAPEATSDPRFKRIYRLTQQ